MQLPSFCFSPSWLAGAAGWLAVALLLSPAAAVAQPILEVSGTLADGDAVWPDDETLYDLYRFEANAGQAVVITLESDEFDTYLLLRDEQGQILFQNDDSSDATTNAAIAVVLPAAGTYEVVANSYGSSDRGPYRLSITPTEPSDPLVRKFEADELNRQGRRLDNQAQYAEALTYYERSLAIRQEIGDQHGIGISLNNIGGIYDSLDDYAKALDYYQQSLAIFQETGNKDGTSDVLNNIGITYSNLGDYPKALDYYQQSLLISQEISDEGGEAISLSNIGSIYDNIGDYPKALGYYQQSLTIFRDINDEDSIGTSLNNIGGIYFSLGDYSKALDFYQQSLAIFQDIGDRSGTSDVLNNIGSIHESLGDYPKALDYYQQSLAIFQEIGSRSGISDALNNIGGIYDSLGDYAKALDYFQQSLAISQEIGDKDDEAISFNNIGFIYYSLGDYPKALEYYQQGLAISQEIGDKSSIGTSLNNIGTVYSILGEYPKALDYFQQSLAIRQEIGDRYGETIVLNNIGRIYHRRSDYTEALEYHQQSLEISREIDSKSGEEIALNNIGTIYDDLGDYTKALDYYQQSLVITQQIGNPQSEAISLNNIGGIYDVLEDYSRALDYYQQGLAIVQGIGDQRGTGQLLNNIGGIYDSLGDYSRALDYYQQSLAIRQEIGDKNGEAISLNNIGFIYTRLSDHPKALDYYQQSLTIHQEIGDKSGEALSLSNIGATLADQNQPELAVVFLKQAVNRYEAIRGTLQSLDSALQSSYTDTVASTYRKLADLLLQENRILEAQRVLDLLKVQELDEYLQDVQRSSQTEAGVAFWQVETDLLTLYQQVLEQASELAQLEAKPRSARTAAEQQRLDTLRTNRDAARGWFNRFLDDPTVVETLAQIRDSTQGQNLEPESFNDLTNNLRLLPQKTAALYPLILENRLELVLILPEGPPLRYPIAVSAAELNQAIVDFGQALKSPSSDLQPLAQQLYHWLVGPMAQQLEQAEIESILYAPDGALRYIPLAALHDGEQYLAQRFSISYLTADSLSDLNLQPQRQDRRLLAAACAECDFTVEVGAETFSFSALPHTATEVQTLAQQFETVDVLLNQAFNAAAMADLPGYSIIHLATHAAFVVGAPEESFILFGDEGTINLSEIREEWALNNAELVVLSACETAVGSTELGSGIEILGLGYQMERAGAQATLASLWKVSDGGTQVLMSAFYGALQQGMTKTAALQAAQQALITGDFTAVGGIRGDIELIDSRTGQPISGHGRLNHPYYWAPFILIGNGL